MKRHHWSIAVFGVNEAATIAACLGALDDNAAGRDAHVSLLLNGTTDDSVEVARAVRLRNVSLSTYTFPVADKANTINRFLYDLRPEADGYFFVDAYARVGAGALDAMTQHFSDHPDAHITTGVPVNGRSAEASTAAILRGAAVNGQLYAMRPGFVERIVAAGLRLPLALYRGDPLLASMAAHDLDALGTKWSDSRVAGVARATFEISPLSIFRWSDVKRQFHREIRQARGRMENAAIKSIIYERGYAALPDDANAMIRNWLRRHAPEPRSLRERMFTRLALRHLALARNFRPEDLVPTLAFSTVATGRVQGPVTGLRDR